MQCAFSIAHAVHMTWHVNVHVQVHVHVHVHVHVVRMQCSAHGAHAMYLHVASVRRGRDTLPGEGVPKSVT